jgi:cellulose biosynthesis protein BcsQ
MRVIALASQKGGSGKTTTAAHLAVQAGRVGQGPAVMVDPDPQASLGEWWLSGLNPFSSQRPPVHLVGFRSEALCW